MSPPKDSLTDHLEKNWITVLINWFINTVTYHRKWVYGTTAVVAAISLYGLTLIKTTGNIVDDLPKDHPIVNDLRWFESNFGGVVPFEIEINAGKPRQVVKTSILTNIDQAQELFRDNRSFSKSISIVDAMKFIRQAFYNGNPERYGLIDSRERAFFKDYIENAEKDRGLLYAYIDSTQQYARISLQVADVATHEMDSILTWARPRVDSIFNPKRIKQDSLLNAARRARDPLVADSLAKSVINRNAPVKRAFERELAKDDTAAHVNLDDVDFASSPGLLTRLSELVEDEYIKINFTGPSITFLEGTNYLVRNLFISLGIAIVIVALLMALVFSSLRMIIVSVITNLLPLLFTAAVMGYFNVAIKPSTLLVFSIAFGISVDDTIHYLAKYRQELKLTGNDIGKSVRRALKETGVSMVYTSIILFFGFSVFDSSQFGGTQALGLLVSLTLLIAMMANLVLLPSFLMSFERSMVTKSFQEPFLTILDEEEDLDLDELDFDDSTKEKQ